MTNLRVPRSAVHLLAGLMAAGVVFSAAARANAARPLKLVIAHGPGQRSFAEFQKYLEQNYQVECDWLVADKGKPFGDLGPLKDCDVILTNLYRTEATPEQLEQLKQHFRSKPVVGMRRAHHGFQNWLEADVEVFGVDYRGHYFGSNVAISIVDKHKHNPMFQDVDTGRLPDGGLYQHLDPAEDVEVYIIGGPEDKPPMPQTWSRLVKDRGQRVFYTRYGPNDLEDEGVRGMVIKALFWAAGRAPDKMKK